MTEANTVLDPVPVSQLGLVPTHEHAFVCIPRWKMDARNAYDRKVDAESISMQLATLLKQGVKTIAGATPVDIRRKGSSVVH